MDWATMGASLGIGVFLDRARKSYEAGKVQEAQHLVARAAQLHLITEHGRTIEIKTIIRKLDQLCTRP